jgi:predicted nuclease of predicted toxin-antitoxin system
VKILIDMNLSPAWVPVFQNAGFEAIHWTKLGDLRASDETVFHWARIGGYVVFTHQLEFGAMISATMASGPSVLQVRTMDVTPESLGEFLIQALLRHQVDFEAGAFVTVDSTRSTVRILPIQTPARAVK